MGAPHLFFPGEKSVRPFNGPDINCSHPGPDAVNRHIIPHLYGPLKQQDNAGYKIIENFIRQERHGSTGTVRRADKKVRKDQVNGRALNCW